MADPILSVEGLSTGYGDFQALFDVSLSLDPNSILGLVGANGAGKSTLFKAILGLLPRGRDTVRFRGRPIGDARTQDLSRLGVVMVPEGRRLFQTLTVATYVAVGIAGLMLIAAVLLIATTIRLSASMISSIESSSFET